MGDGPKIHRAISQQQRRAWASLSAFRRPLRFRKVLTLGDYEENKAGLLRFIHLFMLLGQATMLFHGVREKKIQLQIERNETTLTNRRIDILGGVFLCWKSYVSFF